MSFFQFEEKPVGDDDEEHEEEKNDENTEIDENDNDDEGKAKGLILKFNQIIINFIFRCREKEINR